GRRAAPERECVVTVVIETGAGHRGRRGISKYADSVGGVFESAGVDAGSDGRLSVVAIRWDQENHVSRCVSRRQDANVSFKRAGAGRKGGFMTGPHVLFGQMLEF